MNEKLKEIIEKSKRIVFFGGAGVSTESGIPDFRSESGSFKALQAYGQPPEYLISRSCFDRKPEIFYDYYRQYLLYPQARPNPAHKVLAKWEEEGILDSIVTQNIDGLHQLAGSKTVHELHGSVLRNYCMDCGAFYDLEQFLSLLGHGDSAKVLPLCTKCGGLVKPDVVLYEEALDQDVMNAAVSAISKADTLIIGGTSLVVYPAAGLIDYFHGDNLILLNKTKTSRDSRATLAIYEPIGEVLGSTFGKNI